MKFMLPLIIWIGYAGVVFMLYPRRKTFFVLVGVPTILVAVLLLCEATWPQVWGFLTPHTRLLLGIFTFGMIFSAVFYQLKQDETTNARIARQRAN